MTSRWLVLRKGAAAAATAGATPSCSLARSSVVCLGSSLPPPYQHAAFSSFICQPVSACNDRANTSLSSSSSLTNHHHQQLQQIRCKHSARQLNLKLINHPTVYRRRRREERHEQLLQLLDDDANDETLPEHEQDVEVQSGDDEHVKVLVGTIYRFQRVTIRAQPRYATWFTPEFLPNGWSAPPTEADTAAAVSSTTSLPFSIRRTGHKPNDAVGFLPVYSDQGRNDGTKVTTRIKKIEGNVQELVRELQAVLYQHHSNLPQPSPPPSPHPLLQMPPPLVRIPRIRIRAQGDVIEVDGNHVRTIKTWLAGLGF